MVHQFFYVDWLHPCQFTPCLKPLSKSMVSLKLMTPLAGLELCSKSLCPKSIFHQSFYSSRFESFRGSYQPFHKSSLCIPNVSHNPASISYGFSTFLAITNPFLQLVIGFWCYKTK